MDGNMLSYKSHSNSTGDDGSRLLVSATREPRSKGDSGFPIVGFGRLSRRAPRTIVGSRLLASAMREPRVQFKFDFKASCAEEVVPNGTFPQGFSPTASATASLGLAPKRLCRRVRSRRGSRPTVSSTVFLVHVLKSRFVNPTKQGEILSAFLKYFVCVSTCSHNQIVIIQRLCSKT